MNIETNVPLLEDILLPWKEQIGEDYPGYRGHVYRMWNYCLALRPCSDEEKKKLAITACFHDLGLWSDHTVDYIPPSIAQLKRYLDQPGLGHWADEMCLMVAMHHKVRRYDGPHSALVELFRRGDLVDFSLGLVTFGLPRSTIRDVKAAIPNNGFHRFLMKGAKEWFLQHPFSLPPFIRW